MHLIFDGLTLTKASKNVDLRQQHAAQNIQHMWMKKAEKMDPAQHTHIRYGVQFGTKVFLWSSEIKARQVSVSGNPSQTKQQKPKIAPEAPKVQPRGA